MRSRLRPWFAEHGGHVGLVVLLAVATPVGAALQSAVGTNVFRTRSLAPSWPYLALAVAALITVGPPGCGARWPPRWPSPPSGSRP